ncbi:hypothetical protein ACJMK2_023085 [Sinanodonta woodiana]|uniref:RETREG1-3/ARL6IP-like N-terminal reticulon-homology domain-containing protein n=1 Tax=Sinanodonta woodiana TaxID=1069815 RepID=A0ABD3T4P1_SINWO
MDTPESQDNDNPLTLIEERFRTHLSPVEPLIMRIQSLLVWEYPLRSFVLFVIVHVLFWLAATSTCRFYCLSSIMLLVLFVAYTWKRKTGPNLQVEPIPSLEDSDSWIQVHPHLLSVPELCEHLALVWFWLSSYVRGWFNLRSHKPLQFCFVNTLGFTFLAFIGHYIPGIAIVYTLVITLLLWPCLLYHKLIQKCYLKVEPMFMKLDYSMKMKSKWTYRDHSAPAPVMQEDNAINGDSSVVVDNESDLEDFYPSIDPEVTAALARAITDSEDEGGPGTGTPSLPSPGLSKEPSFCNSEDKHHSDVEAEFAEGIGQMPDYDEVNNTDEDILEPGSREGSTEPIRFIPSHFDDSSDSDDLNTLTTDIDTRDFGAEGDSNRRIQKVKDPQTVLAEGIVKHALSSMMASALQSLTNLTQAGSQAPLSQADQGHVAFRKKTKEEDVLHLDKAPSNSDDSADFVDEEFEFLDDYELEEEEN